MGDSRSHWRAGAYAFEHETVISGSVSSKDLCALQWVPKQTDESISFAFDEPNDRLAARGILVSLYGLTSLPAFGLRLRLKEALVSHEGWRHSVSITMPVASWQATAAIVTFETPSSAMTSNFVEISTYEWPIRSSYLSEQVQDTLHAVGGSCVRSKIQWFREREKA